MSEQISRVASIIQPPVGEVIIPKSKIIDSLISKGIGFVAMGFADAFQREIPLDEHGIAYVGMNKTGSLVLPRGESGVIATSSLAGCTGVAGFALRRDGSIAAFVSHYDPMSQNSLLTGEASPVNKDLYGFRHLANKTKLATPIYYLIAYSSDEHDNPRHGKRNGVFKDWGYLEQIGVTATQLGEDSRVILMPYNGWRGDHTLASGRADEAEGLFWDGVRVDFDAYLE